MDSNLLDGGFGNSNNGSLPPNHPLHHHHHHHPQQQQQSIPHFGGPPQSPVDLKPDASVLLTSLNNSGSSNNSPTSPNAYNFGSPQGGGGGRQACNSPSPQQPQHQPVQLNNYPPNHPLSGSKHFCSICGDRASGKHYGVYSCEGCKGFFKRTVRKELSYACRENRDCIIDKRQRNRCQYCRYMKCLQTGMRREAVQEERHRGSSGGGTGNGQNQGNSNPSGRTENEVESTSSGSGDMPIERIIEAEDIGEANPGKHDDLLDATNNGETDIQRFGLAKKRIVHQLIEWAKMIPQFSDLKVDDQVTLIRSGWNELLVAGLAFRSMKLNDGILLGNGTVVTRENAHEAGVGHIFDRVLVELVSKMKEMQMDKAELGCLRAIVLFNPDAKGLSDVNKVETLREKVYATLEEYTRSAHENEPSRFAKLLLRLPALRSIGLKCLEHLFFYKIIGDYLNDGNPLEQFIQTLLEEC